MKIYSYLFIIMAFFGLCFNTLSQNWSTPRPNTTIDMSVDKWFFRGTTNTPLLISHVWIGGMDGNTGSIRLNGLTVTNFNDFLVNTNDLISKSVFANYTNNQHTLIQSIQSDIDTLENSLVNVESNLNSNSTSISNLESNVTNLQASVTNLENSVDNIQDTVNDLDYVKSNNGTATNLILEGTTKVNDDLSVSNSVVVTISISGNILKSVLTSTNLSFSVNDVQQSSIDLFNGILSSGFKIEGSPTSELDIVNYSFLTNLLGNFSSGATQYIFRGRNSSTNYISWISNSPNNSVAYFDVTVTNGYGVELATYPRSRTNYVDLLTRLANSEVFVLYPGQLVKAVGNNDTYWLNHELWSTNYNPFTTNSFPLLSSTSFVVFVEDGVDGGVGPKGDPGADGVGDIQVSEWSSTAYYNFTNTWVEYGGQVYRLLAPYASSNQVPTLNTSVWRVAIAKGASGTVLGSNMILRGAFDAGISYTNGDAVTYSRNTFWISPTNVPSLGVFPSLDGNGVGVDNAVWTVAAGRGGVGATGPQGIPGGTTFITNLFQTYLLGDTNNIIIGGNPTSTNQVLTWVSNNAEKVYFRWTSLSNLVDASGGFSGSTQYIFRAVDSDCVGLISWASNSALNDIVYFDYCTTNGWSGGSSSLNLTNANGTLAADSNTNLTVIPHGSSGTVYRSNGPEVPPSWTVLDYLFASGNNRVIDFSDNIFRVGTPQAGNEAANKDYVDQVVVGGSASNAVSKVIVDNESGVVTNIGVNTLRIKGMTNVTLSIDGSFTIQEMDFSEYLSANEGPDLPEGTDDWLSTSNYMMSNVVVQLGSFYFSLVNNNSNNIPMSSPTFWAKTNYFHKSVDFRGVDIRIPTYDDTAADRPASIEFVSRFSQAFVSNALDRITLKKGLPPDYTPYVGVTKLIVAGAFAVPTGGWDSNEGVLELEVFPDWPDVLNFERLGTLSIEKSSESLYDYIELKNDLIAGTTSTNINIQTNGTIEVSSELKIRSGKFSFGTNTLYLGTPVFVTSTLFDEFDSEDTNAYTNVTSYTVTRTTNFNDHFEFSGNQLNIGTRPYIAQMGLSDGLTFISSNVFLPFGSTSIVTLIESGIQSDPTNGTFVLSKTGWYTIQLNASWSAGGADIYHSAFSSNGVPMLYGRVSEELKNSGDDGHLNALLTGYYTNGTRIGISMKSDNETGGTLHEFLFQINRIDF